MSLDKTTLDQLFQAALNAQKMSHAPFSHYHVGAAILMPDGQIISGCNIENSAFCPSVCGERVALFKMRSQTLEKPKALLILTRDAAMSCGVCLQVISELAPDAELIYVDEAKTQWKHFSLKDLLPQQFAFETV